MANKSIYDAFERMWQHINLLIDNKVSQSSKIQIVTWEEND